MPNTFHILNAEGIEIFQDFLLKNQKSTEYTPLPTHLIDNSQYYTDTEIPFDISPLVGLDLWQIGEKLVSIIDENTALQHLDFTEFWASLSLYFAHVILPEKYNGRTKPLLEWRQSLIRVQLIFEWYQSRSKWKQQTLSPLYGDLRMMGDNLKSQAHPDLGTTGDQ